MIGVTGAGHRSTTRLLDAAFPKYRQLIPTEHTTTATVNVSDLVSVIKRVALVADRTSQIALTFQGGGVTVTAGGDDQGSAEEMLPCDIVGDGLTIGFNSGYVLDALAAAGTTRARFAFTLPTKPAVIRPVDDATGDTVDGTLFLLMPVRQPG
jgi:DNA polymerase-3 subunit beta